MLDDIAFIRNRICVTFSLFFSFFVSVSVSRRCFAVPKITETISKLYSSEYGEKCLRTKRTCVHVGRKTIAKTKIALAIRKTQVSSTSILWNVFGLIRLHTGCVYMAISKGHHPTAFFPIFNIKSKISSHIEYHYSIARKQQWMKTTAFSLPLFLHRSEFYVFIRFRWKITVIYCFCVFSFGNVFDARHISLRWFVWVGLLVRSFVFFFGQTPETRLQQT